MGYKQKREDKLLIFNAGYHTFNCKHTHIMGLRTMHPSKRDGWLQIGEKNLLALTPMHNIHVSTKLTVNEFPNSYAHNFKQRDTYYTST